MRPINEFRSLVLVILVTFVACSKEEKIKFPGNAFLVFDVAEEKAVDGTDMTIKRTRVWKSAPNTDTPGVSTLVETYTVEIWYLLNGEEKTRYSILTGLIGDEDQNLFGTNATPGTKTVRLASARIAGTELFNYTVTPENGLVSEEYPVASAWDEITTAGGITTSTIQIIKAHEIAESPWSSIRYRSMPEGFIGSRLRYEENAGFTTKAKIGCTVKTINTSAEMLPKTYIFGEVELGNVFQDKSGQSTSGTPTTLGDDDGLWIPWSEYWLLAGISIKDRKLKILRVRSAPFYNSRELPGVDVSDTKPKISGMETLVRTCNGAAARSGGYFSMVSLSGSPLAPSLNLGSTNTFCQALVDNVASNPDQVRLDTFSPCSFSGLSSVGNGTWNGSAHSGPITSAGTTLTHVEQTEIKDVQF